MVVSHPRDHHVSLCVFTVFLKFDDEIFGKKSKKVVRARSDPERKQLSSSASAPSTSSLGPPRSETRFEDSGNIKCCLAAGGGARHPGDCLVRQSEACQLTAPR